MLIEFSVENFRSIKDEIRLSLVAGPGREHRETHLVTPELNEGVRSVPLVRSAALYGANASGKTNLIRALQVMQHIVTHSGRELDDLPVVPFQFDPESRVQPTTFEVVGIANRMRFQYGFSARRNIVTEEWLYAWPLGRIQFWFERTTDADTGTVGCKFGDKLAGDKEVWRRATRPDALLLSTAITLNSEQLQPVFGWFSGNVHVAGVGGWNNGFSLDWCGGDRKTEVVRFLQAADLAIEDLRLVHRDFLPEMLPAELPPEVRRRMNEELSMVYIDPPTNIHHPEVRRRMNEELSRDKLVQVQVSHDTSHGQPTELDLDEESDGTQKMFALAAPWLDTLANGRVIVFDELHDNLHPALVRFLVERFHNPEVSAKGAQLVFTTHDTSILNQDVFRRDQIWFCERNSRQETQIFPLTEFRPRRGVENLERSYLAGRYGALPYIRTANARSKA